MKGSEVFPKEVPSKVVVEQRSEPVGNSSKAGVVVGMYEDALQCKLNRIGVQVAFSLYFFDHCCNRCGSPFHNKEKDVQCQVVPGVAHWVRRIQDVNHPPTALQRLENFKTKKMLNVEIETVDDD